MYVSVVGGAVGPLAVQQPKMKIKLPSLGGRQSGLGVSMLSGLRRRCSRLHTDGPSSRACMYRLLS